MVSSKLKSVGVFCFMLSALCFQPAKAQTFSEWFSQKKTLIKYLTQQISALESFESDVKKGYTIATGGLSNIGSITGAEFSLHQSYFASLKAVNPAVKNNPDLAAISQYAEAISRDLGGLNHLNGLDDNTRTYIGQVTHKVLQECNIDLSELEPIVFDGQVQMTDQERLNKLHEIYEHIKDKYVFTRHFCNAVNSLQQQKMQDAQSIQTLKNVYGNN